MNNFQKGNPKILNGWAFYDWANSVYALVISSSIFPLFYGALFRLKEWESYPILGMQIPSESIISYVTAISFAVVSILSPDRKSTRLNSSHVRTSYAAFCLKKKKRIAAEAV